MPGGISLDGLAVLVDDGQFMNTPSHGFVKAVPFAGGPATTLVSHAASAELEPLIDFGNQRATAEFFFFFFFFLHQPKPGRPTTRR